MSVGVRVGSAVGMVVEAALGSGFGSAVAAVAAVVFLIGAMMRLSRSWCRPVLSKVSTSPAKLLYQRSIQMREPILGSECTLHCV